MQRNTLTRLDPDHANTDPQRLAVEAHVHRTKAVAALSPKSRADLAPATLLELSQQEARLKPCSLRKGGVLTSPWSHARGLSFGLTGCSICQT